MHPIFKREMKTGAGLATYPIKSLASITQEAWASKTIFQVWSQNMCRSFFYFFYCLFFRPNKHRKVECDICKKEFRADNLKKHREACQKKDSTSSGPWRFKLVSRLTTTRKCYGWWIGHNTVALSQQHLIRLKAQHCVVHSHPSSYMYERTNPLSLNSYNKSTSDLNFIFIKLYNFIVNKIAAW